MLPWCCLVLTTFRLEIGLSIVVACLVWSIRSYRSQHGSTKATKTSKINAASTVIPGPAPSSFIFGNGLDTLGSVPRWHITGAYPEPFLSWIHQYGGAVYYRELYTKVVLFSDPKALQHILALKESNYPRNRSIRAFLTDTLLGTSLLSSEGSDHAHQRKTMNPHFSQAQIKPFVSIFELYTRERLLPALHDVSQSQSLANLTKVFQKLTLGTIGKIAFSMDFDEHPTVHEAIMQLLATPSVSTYLGLLYIPGFSRLPLPELNRRRAAKKIIFEAITRVIEGKLASKSPQTDLLDLILPHASPRKLSTLSWVVVEACRRPQVVAKIRQECQKVLKKYGSMATWESTQEMPYTTAVIQESLRLNSVVYGIPRRDACEDDEVPMSDGSSIFIPKGTSIAMIAAAIHRNPRYWTKPNEFIPERFLPGTPEWTADEVLRGGSSHNFYFLPFSMGTKNCIGLRFAMAEIRVILAMLFANFDIKINAASNLFPKFNGMTIHPADLQVTIHALEN
ncbi:hypothetical protein AeMF1_011948 [Aphanomyces euteiches]|nr:hypothetical protein AeMF1_011948 [Aphanomyces euteiches]KAH9180905.1 hypothetical protein AeNC1_017119 [Aphanomyces euteiches]